MNQYDRGDQPRVATTFAAGDGTPADPTLVVLTVRNPLGVLTTPSVTNPAVGSYYADVPLGVSGTWSYRWTATGAVANEDEVTFYVRERLT